MIDERDVREALRRRADAIAATPADPPAAVRRARRRLTRNGVVAGVAALALAGATFVSVRAVVDAKPPVPAAPSGNGLISFDMDQRLYVIEPDGTGLRDVLGPPLPTCQAVEEEICPITQTGWSPGGSLLAFLEERDPKDGHQDAADLAVVGPQGGTPRVLVRCHDCLRAGFAWSPDGARIAFADAGSLKVIDVDGGQARGIGDCPDPGRLPVNGCAGLAWSPDGSLIGYFQETELPTDAIEVAWYVAGPDGSGSRRVAVLPVEGAPSTMSWSPDGSTILFDGPEGTYIADLDGSAPRLLIEDREGPAAAQWSPDGTRIAYVTTPRDQGGFVWELRLADAAGRYVTTVYRTACCIYDWRPPLWSPDGRYLAFEVVTVKPGGSPSDTEGDLYIIGADGSGLASLLPLRTTTRVLAWQPV
jgi:Tol biopolymer transport system component